MNKENMSEKDWVFTLIICMFFGIFGFHRFYVGKKGTGYLYLFTCSFLGIGWILDMIKLLTGTFKDKDGNSLEVNLPWKNL